MEKKINDLRQQVETLAKRIQKAIDNKSVSSIEIDIVMEQLRNSYVIAEEIKEIAILNSKSKTPYTAPGEELPESPVVVKHPEILVTVPPMPKPPKAEQVIPDPETEPEEEPFVLPGEKFASPVHVHEMPVQAEPSHMQSPVMLSKADLSSAADLPSTADKIEKVDPVSVPIPEKPFEPAPVSIEDIPAMKFPEIEVVQSKHETPYVAPIINKQPIESELHYADQIYSTPVAPTPVHEPAQQSYYTAPDQIAAPKQTPSPTPQPERSSVKSSDLFGSQTLADKFKKETPSLNEKIIQGREDHTLAHKMQLKPITDLKTAIGINEKFQLVNDLFQGRIDLYNDAINRLNTCGSSYSAEGILDGLKSSHNWKDDADAYGKLKTFITRRYLS